MPQDLKMNVPTLKKPVSGYQQIGYLALALSGLSFLFFLGFPFDNHNESYLWVTLLDKINFIDALTKRLEPVQSFRPLGTATAWITYTLSGNVYLQQLLNWCCACVSFVVLFRYAGNKSFFSITAFLATAGFFSGYIYLFHLHGVFYGPLQLYIALLTGVAYTNRALGSKKRFFLFLLTLIAALYHTFALLVFAGYIAGYILDVPRKNWRSRIPELFGYLIVTLLSIYFILRLHPSKADGDPVSGTLASFTTTELNLPLRLLAALFVVITVFTFPVRAKIKAVLVIAALLSSFLLVYLKLPVLLLWIAACILKMGFLKRWALAALIAATAILPAATHTGTPTYIVFVIMVCVFATAADTRLLSTPPPVVNKSIPVVLTLLLLVLLLLKAGIAVPGVATGLRPMLAEQEKTEQLKAILGWKRNAATYSNNSLRFLDESGKPAASQNAVNRKNRPPTQQSYLNRYCRAMRLNSRSDTITTPPLIVTFGGKVLPDRQKVFEVQGRWNGTAYVYQ